MLSLPKSLPKAARKGLPVVCDKLRFMRTITMSLAFTLVASLTPSAQVATPITVYKTPTCGYKTTEPRGAQEEQVASGLDTDEDGRARQS